MIASAVRATAAHAIRHVHSTHEHSQEISQTWWHPDLDTQVSPIDELPEAENGNIIFERRYAGKHHPRDPAPYTFGRYAKLVGFSGLNYVNGTVEFLTYDIDCGKGANQQTEEQIDELIRFLDGTPGVEVRRSKGGKGIHIRVRIAPVQLESNTVEGMRKEYDALALAMMPGLNLVGKVCSKACILHSYAKNAKEDSFRLVNRAIGEHPVPDNWRNLVPETTVSRSSSATLDNQLIDEIRRHGFKAEVAVLDGTEVLKTHTCGLRAAHKSLGLPGEFKTVSPGTNPGKPNCYGVPQPDGSLRICRYKALEPTWNRTERGLSWCWFNSPFYAEDWSTLTENHGGVHPNGLGKNVRRFGDASKATPVLRELGVDAEIPAGRPVDLELDGDSVEVSVPRLGDEPTPNGFVESGKKFAATLPIDDVRDERPIHESTIRCGYFYSESGRQNGSTLWFILQPDGVWRNASLPEVRSALASLGHPKRKAEKWIGEQLRNQLKISLEPFKSGESDGYWFRGYQLAYEPAPGEHPHFDKILRHTGEDLDEYVAADAWCQANGIRDGHDYLLVYCAKTFQDPAARLPELYLFSVPQNTGKDSFAMMLGVPMEPGAVQDAKSAAINPQGFNGELEGTVVNTLNEMDLSKSDHAEARSRELVTNPILDIHPKGMKPYQVKNYGRVIQTANSLAFKRIDTEDSRTVVIELSEIPKSEQLDWATVLRPALEKEAPAFLHTVLNYELPAKGAPGSRCYLPVLMTEAKKDAAFANLRKLSDADDCLLNEVIAKVESQEWQGVKEHSEIRELVDAPANSRKWGAFWTRVTPHLKALGYSPVHRRRVEHKCSAAWGF